MFQHTIKRHVSHLWGDGDGRTTIVIKRSDIQKMTKMFPFEMIRTHLH